MEHTMELETIEFTIEDYRVPSWNQFYVSRHWSMRSRMAQEAHVLVWAAIQACKKLRASFTKPVDIHIKAYQKGRTLDSDNICAKILIDGLKGTVIVDDTPKYVRRVTTESIKADHDYVEINLTETKRR